MYIRNLFCLRKTWLIRIPRRKIVYIKLQLFVYGCPSEHLLKNRYSINLSIIKTGLNVIQCTIIRKFAIVDKKLIPIYHQCFLNKEAAVPRRIITG